MYRISHLQQDEYQSYTNFLLRNEHNLFYASLKYKQLLYKLLDCEDHFLIVKDENGKIVGALPLMMSRNGTFGPIANSLPYYGSNGGVIADRNIPDDDQSKVKLLLLSKADEIIKERGCGAFTIITNPLDQNIDFYENNIPHTFRDERIGQITELPVNGNDLDSRLIALFQNPRPRNIRKAIKSDVTCRFSYDDEDLNFLFTTHEDNISSIGGLSKDVSFFRLVPDVFNHNEYRVYIAEKDGRKIAALLLFYFNKTVEYFTPTVIDKARPLQPTALIIYEAMKDAITAGYRYWNWGGTWVSQTGVYDFKKRWGAGDYPYYYYITLYKHEILDSSQSELLEQYPGFYVVPFGHLKRRHGNG